MHVCAYLQCVATHSLLQYSLSQSWLSTAGLTHPARTHTLVLAAGATLDPGVTLTSTSIWRENIRQSVSQEGVLQTYMMNYQ